MTRQCRSFAAEFKQEGASMVLGKGYFVHKASHLQDVNETLLLRRIQQYQSECSGTTPISKAQTHEQPKIQ